MGQFAYETIVAAKEAEDPQRGEDIHALHVLAEVTANLAGESDVEELLQRFLTTLIRLSGASAGAVRVLSSDERHLRLVGAQGLPAEMMVRERIVPLSCGACGNAVVEDAVQQVGDMTDCARRTHLAYFERCDSMVVVPLRRGGRVLGVYNLYQTEPRPLREEVSLLFRSISEHLAMALENARLTRENLRMALMNERQMVANEVHDSLAQTLAYMRMRLGLLAEALEGGSKQRALRYAGDVREALDESYASLRGLLSQFRDRMDPLGLMHAIRKIAQSFHSRTGIAMSLQERVPDLRLSPDEEVQVFHIVQEALANVARHSGAKHVWLIMELCDAEYVITVNDDGRGAFELGAVPDLRHHFGISIMRERAQRLGGRVEIGNRPEGGARLRLVFPVRPAKAFSGDEL